MGGETARKRPTPQEALQQLLRDQLPAHDRQSDPDQANELPPRGSRPASKPVDFGAPGLPLEGVAHGLAGVDVQTDLRILRPSRRKRFDIGPGGSAPLLADLPLLKQLHPHTVVNHDSLHESARSPWEGVAVLQGLLRPHAPRGPQHILVALLRDVGRVMVAHGQPGEADPQ